jgi:hypothetical protein
MFRIAADALDLLFHAREGQTKRKRYNAMDTSETLNRVDQLEGTGGEN